MNVKERFKQLFMSKEQTIYLVFLFLSCVIYGTFAATYTHYEIAKGSRYYSSLLSIGCIVGVIHAYIATDIKKKKWVFRHYKAIDLGESIFFTCTEAGFLTYYIVNELNPIITPERVENLFFFYFVFYRIIHAIISVVIPSIGDVFEQSLYKNQIDYQNHSNAENMMCCFGAAIGAGGCWIVGDYFIENPYWIFCMILFDWIGLWSRWQFYFKPSNYSIIKRNFAKDCGEKLRKLHKDKLKVGDV